MSQLVFLRGPGAGGCAEAFRYQLDNFPGSLAPTLPGHGTGASCASVERYTEWVRGWLWPKASTATRYWSYTLGACIALQYGLDYPEDVSGLGAQDRGHAPETSCPRQCRYAAASRRGASRTSSGSPPCGSQCGLWPPSSGSLPSPGHCQVGPRSQYHDLAVIDQFDAGQNQHIDAATAAHPWRRRFAGSRRI